MFYLKEKKQALEIIADAMHEIEVNLERDGSEECAKVNCEAMKNLAEAYSAVLRGK